MCEAGCGTCHGQDRGCVACAGRGVIEQFRCPSATLGAAPGYLQHQVDLLLRCYLQYDNRHTLPVEGGLLDQTRSFVAWCEIIDAERGRYESMKEEKRQRDSEAARRKSQPRHGR